MQHYRHTATLTYRSAWQLQKLNGIRKSLPMAKTQLNLFLVKTLEFNAAVATFWTCLQVQEACNHHKIIVIFNTKYRTLMVFSLPSTSGAALLQRPLAASSQRAGLAEVEQHLSRVSRRTRQNGSGWFSCFISFRRQLWNNSPKLFFIVQKISFSFDLCYPSQ